MGHRIAGLAVLLGIVTGFAVMTPARAAVVATRHFGPWTLTLSAEKAGPHDADVARRGPTDNGASDDGGMPIIPGSGMGNGDGSGPGMGGGTGPGKGGGTGATLFDSQHANTRFILRLRGPVGASVRAVRLIAVQKATFRPSLALLRPTSPGPGLFSGVVALPGTGAYVIQTRFKPDGAAPEVAPVVVNFDYTFSGR